MSELLAENDKTSVQNVARLAHCYLMASVLAPGQSSTVAWHFTYYLEDFDEYLKYVWCGYIADVLHKHIRGTRNLKIGGCAMLLPYWLCEHITLVEPIEEFLFPRFLKWDLTKLKKRVKHVNLTYLGSKYVNRVAINPTSEEKTKIRGLLEGCLVESSEECIVPDNEGSEEKSRNDDLGKKSTYTGMNISDDEEQVLTAKLDGECTRKGRREGEFTPNTIHVSVSVLETILL